MIFFLWLLSSLFIFSFTFVLGFSMFTKFKAVVKRSGPR